MRAPPSLEMDRIGSCPDIFQPFFIRVKIILAPTDTYALIHGHVAIKQLNLGKV